ncbi:MAG: HEPN domain-containing protein [Nitrospira sp.]|nr:HEPN domain-containing protein [Nitrospira sp.]
MREVQSLMKPARKYLKSAEILLNEADHESCVSRAYYAMFYAAEAALLTKRVTSSSHKGVIAAFNKH